MRDARIVHKNIYSAETLLDCFKQLTDIGEITDITYGRQNLNMIGGFQFFL